MSTARLVLVSRLAKDSQHFMHCTAGLAENEHTMHRHEHSGCEDPECDLKVSYFAGQKANMLMVIEGLEGALNTARTLLAQIEADGAGAKN